MKNTIFKNLAYLSEICPFPLYIVGGRVRDFLAGLESAEKDNDICAPAKSEDFVAYATRAGFTVNAVYKNTGTVKLSCNGENYEFSSFRSDEYVRGVHTPVNTLFTDDILLDAKRRDFKCNAVYYDISAGQFVDPLGGIPDIHNKTLTTVAPPEKVFGEDGLRLMRLARISAQTGFTPSAECIAGAAKNAELISDVSPERIYAELNGILHADLKYGINYAQYAGLDILRKTGVLKYILPELALGDKMEQRSDFHDHDVLEHSFRAVKYAKNEVRLAALLHDVGKPYCKINYGKYHGHDIEGARIALDICARLRVPKKLAEQTVKLVELHMYDLDLKAKESKVRKFIIKNYAYMPELLLLKQADFSACKDDLSASPSVVKLQEITKKMQAEKVPFTAKQLDLRGDELIAAGCPKEKTGKVLERLLMECAASGLTNERGALLNYAVKVAFNL